ncbi:Mss4-like protein [Panaeolus papilionaceus]|nr:Mss4-like protein [Panaeolus papilionaceus]
MSSEPLTYIKASCLCKSNEFIIPFVSASLPQATDMCHCSSCRHITGQLAIHCANAASAPLAMAEGDPTPTAPVDLSKLAKYNASEALTRYFCNTCGAYMLYELHSADSESRWMVSTGSLERTEGIVKVGYHAFIKDTKDGGMTKFYRTLNGVDIPRYGLEEHSETLPADWKEENLATLQKKHQDKLHAHCHCRSISLYLTRPSQEESKDPSKIWLAPGADDSSYPTGHKPPRFLAGHCFCSSCRLSTGALVPSFLILPRANVFDNHNSEANTPITLSKSSPTRLNNLTQYVSSKDTYREFCSTCGATAFYWTKAPKGPFTRDETSPEAVVIDLAAGLLDEEEGGALSEGWVLWHDLPMNIGEAVDKDGANAVAEGSKLALQGL